MLLDFAMLVCHIHCHCLVDCISGSVCKSDATINTSIRAFYLKSSHRAAGYSNTPDETIHLAVAFQFCGFRSVVETLWEMADKAGPIGRDLTSTCSATQEMKANIRDSAEGLSLAVRELRKKTRTFGLLDYICS